MGLELQITIVFIVCVPFSLSRLSFFHPSFFPFFGSFAEVRLLYRQVGKPMKVAS